jgi:AmmeMemoRadiSam system protein B/AmmeMemoRadiSam system protein A
MIRQPVVAGVFYPAETLELEAMIKSMVNPEVVKEEVIGLVSPHAGYIYSGPVAGATISRVILKDTIIILGPNHTGLGAPFSIMTEGKWQTPLGDVEIDTELAQKLLSASMYLQTDILAHEREHSIEVQLPFLQYFKKNIKIVPIVLAPAAGEIYKEIGNEIARVIGESGKGVIIIASSDMTHYENQASVQRKDKLAIDAILKLEADELISRIARSNITMCGYGPVATLISAAKAMNARRAELVRYQTSGDISGEYASVVGYAGIIIRKPGESPLVKLARDTIETLVRHDQVISPPAEPAPEMKEQTGVFVSIHKNGELRGCIGTFEPAYANVASEVIHNAISAATRDPRFDPVTTDELNDLEINVDVLTSPEPIENKTQLDPKRYGCIVERGWKRGLLLPDLEGVNTADQQVEICCRKADITPGEKIKLYRFEVRRYH